MSDLIKMNFDNSLIELEKALEKTSDSEEYDLEAIDEWKTKVKTKIIECEIESTPNSLIDLMNYYLTSLGHMFAKDVFKHACIFYSFHQRFGHDPYPYLDVMEEILTIYCNLEFAEFNAKEQPDKKFNSAAKKIIYSLSVLLLDKQKHALHVLMKLNEGALNGSSTNFMNMLYMYFLMKTPQEFSDEAFCRFYILFQKWKDFRKMELWEQMDNYVYAIFDRKPNYLRDNETVSQILMPKAKSKIDVVVNLFRTHFDLATSYFKFIRSKLDNNANRMDFITDFAIDLDDDYLSTNNKMETADDKVTQVFNEMIVNHPKVQSQTVKKTPIVPIIKQEVEDEDDDVQFVDYIQDFGQNIEKSRWNQKADKLLRATKPSPIDSVAATNTVATATSSVQCPLDSCGTTCEPVKTSTKVDNSRQTNGEIAPEPTENGSEIQNPPAKETSISEPASVGMKLPSAHVVPAEVSSTLHNSQTEIELQSRVEPDQPADSVPMEIDTEAKTQSIKSTENHVTGDFPGPHQPSLDLERDMLHSLTAESEHRTTKPKVARGGGLLHHPQPPTFNGRKPERTNGQTAIGKSALKNKDVNGIISTPRRTPSPSTLPSPAYKNLDEDRDGVLEAFKKRPKTVSFPASVKTDSEHVVLKSLAGAKSSRPTLFVSGSADEFERMSGRKLIVVFEQHPDAEALVLRQQELAKRYGTGIVKRPTTTTIPTGNVHECGDAIVHKPQESVLDLKIPQPVTVQDPDLEFSNSPKFLLDTDKLLVQHCLEEVKEEPSGADNKLMPLLCDNSNFYKSLIANSTNSSHSELDLDVKCKHLYKSAAIANSSGNSESSKVHSKSDGNDGGGIQLPTAVPDPFVFDKTLSFKNEVFSKIHELPDFEWDTKLPIKKRKLTAAEEEKTKQEEEISYPATPMISIAELEALHMEAFDANANLNFNANIHSRPKTLAERKEMPPLPVYYNDPIITDRFNINNHTYNNPTINYHMNNVPVPFINIPCGTSYYSIPPILLPFNNVSNFNDNKTLQTDMKKERKKTTRARRSKP